MVTAPLVNNTSVSIFSLQSSIVCTITAIPNDDEPFAYLCEQETIHIRKDAAHQTLFFDRQGDACSLADASIEVFLAFLENIGYSTADYSESALVPHLRRCDVVNELIRSGKLHVNTEASPYPTDKPLFILEKTRTIVGCAELALEGHWQTAFCCEECHAANDLIRVVLDDQREARVCCVAEKLMEDYAQGKRFDNLPVHED